MASAYFSFPQSSRPLLSKRTATLPKSRKPTSRAGRGRTKELTKYVPYIPPHLVVETVKFLESRPNIKALLDIICSPLQPKEAKEQREIFTRKWEIYKERKRLFNRPYRDQEKLAELSLWRAVNSLPSDLYPEAIRESESPLPLQLRPHYLYRSQIMATLTDDEKRHLQVFQNLMYLRFPFNEVKSKNPGLFWISQLGAINRSRIAKLSQSIQRWRT